MKILLLLLLCLFGLQVHAQHVTFGQRRTDAELNSIYFDRDGMLYPEKTISDEELRGYAGSLLEWYNRHEAYTDSILDVYRLSKEKVQVIVSHGEPSDFTYDPHVMSALNDSLLRKKMTALDALAKGNGLEFYIHGFRKLYQENNRDVTSVSEFGLLKQTLDSLRSKTPLIVCVYWDGMYDCCFSANHKKNKELFQLFETASKNADCVGSSFAQLLHYSTSSHINIVAHSLGTRVAVSGVMQSKNTFTTFNVCLLAPAIPGSLIRGYYEKNTSFPLCNWLVVYNKNDFVLKKKDNKTGIFGPGAYRYGVTTLGCNKSKDAEELAKWLNDRQFNGSFSLLDKSNLGKCHSLRCYTKKQHLQEVSNFLERR